MFDHKHGPSRAHGAFKARFSPVNGGRGGDDDDKAGAGAGAGGGAGNPLTDDPFGIKQSPTSDPDDAPITQTVVVTVQPTSTASKPVKPPVTPTIPATVSKPADTTTAVNTPTPPVDPVTQSSSTVALSTSTTPLVANTQTSILNTIQSATPTSSTAAPTSSKATTTAVKGHASAQNNEGGAITTTAVITAAGKTNHSISSSAPTPTTTSTGVSKGVMVGGISVAVIAGLGILIALLYMLRRCRKREDNFDSNDFKRKSMAIPDGEPEPSAWQPHENASAGGPRPPSMLERSAVQPSFAPSFAPQPDMYMDHNNMGMHNQGGWAQGPSYGHYAPGAQMNGGYPMANTPSFSPGEVVFNSPHSPPATAGPAHHGFFVPGPGAGAYGAARGGMDAYGHPNPGESLPGTPTKPYGSLVDAHASPLQRKDSQTLPSQERESAFYTDMDRASVTPFQARQYSEIQSRLEQIPAPAPPMPAMPAMSASSMSAVSEKQRLAVQNQENDTLSPFDDAAAPAYSLDVSQDQYQSHQEEATHEVDLEEPTPAFAAQHQRIDSKPPTLPELAPRPFSPVSIETHEYSFTLHPGSSGANGPQSAVSEGFPTTPLPPQTPSAAEHKFESQQATPVARAVPTVTVRPETVYDTEDAYDGI
jgi:hypothetical protein